MIEKAKAARVIEYLIRLASVRSRLVYNLDEYEKLVWVSEIPEDRGCFSRAAAAGDESNADIWIEIRNRPAPEWPAIPVNIRDFVNVDSLKNTHKVPTLIEERIRDVDPTFGRTFEQYIRTQWTPWANQYQKWEKVYKIYSDFFSIHQQQIKLGEEYELILGVGLLRWQRPSGSVVRRHVLVANISLEFNSEYGKFIVKPALNGANLRLETDMLDVREQSFGQAQILLVRCSHHG